MSRFPLILKTAIQATPGPVREVATRAGLSEPTLSRLSAGIHTPDPATLGKILPVFPHSTRSALVAAWVEDRGEEFGWTPAQIREALGSADGLAVPEALRRSLTLILARAGDAPEFAQALASLAACLVEPQDRDAWTNGNPFPEAQAVPLHEVAEGKGPDVSKLPRKPATYGKSPKKKA